MRKFIFLLIFILLCIIVAEGYFLFFPSAKLGLTDNVAPTNSVSPDSASPTEPPNYAARALTDYHNHILKMKEHGVIKSTQSEFVYEYTITEVARYTTPIYQPEIQKEALGHIKYETPDDWYQVNLNSHDFDVLTVLDQTGAEEKQITFDDLKAGDYIRYYILTDLYQHPAVAAKKIVITRLK